MVRPKPDITSREIEYEHFSIRARGQVKCGFVRHGGTIAGGERLSIHRHIAARNLHPCMTTRTHVEMRSVARLEQSSVELRIRMHGDRPVTPVRRSDQPQPALLFRIIE